MSRETDLINYSQAKLICTSKYVKAFSYLKDRILDGVSDNDILSEFNTLHKAMPEVFSIAGGRELSKEVLRKFRKGVQAKKKRTDFFHDKGVESGKIQADAATEWKQSSPVYNLVKTRFAENKSYDEIISEIDELYKLDPIGYSSRQGKPISKPILCNWAKELGYDTHNGNKTKVRVEEWKEKSRGYQWFKQQILAGRSQDEIMEQFNELHSSDPDSYSTMMGAGMTISTFTRWRRDVLSETEK